MLKFKIYRAITAVFFIMMLLVTFSPLQSSEAWSHMRQVVTVVLLFLFFICYSLLISIFNYYQEAGWKNVAVIIFLSGNLIFYFLSLYGSAVNVFYNFYLLIFYLPIIFAFATLGAKEMKALAQSFAYLILIICILHIVMPFIRNHLNISVYVYFFDAIFVLPSAIMILMFNKMVSVSGMVQEQTSEDNEEQQDLL
jgi:hypothetical protein